MLIARGDFWEGIVSRVTAKSGMIVLVVVYLGLRVAFRDVEALKLGFIYPVGVGVRWFFGVGEFIWQGGGVGEWVYGVGSTRFVLGSSCSGTTFFSLLGAYMAFRVWRDGVAWWWLLAAYPLTLLVNGVRVVSSIVADGWLVQVLGMGLRDAVHLGVGVVSFLVGFWLSVLLVEWSLGRNSVLFKVLG